MQMLELALQRADAADLSDFQRRQGLPVTGKRDPATEQALMPYLVGYTTERIRAGDTLYLLAQRFGTTVQAIKTANPGLQERNLPIGRVLTIPLGFDVVPTNVNFTSQVLQYAIRGLTARYPFLHEQQIACTGQGKPVTLLHVGTGARRVFYNASHHANEWITTPLLMKFLEEYCKAIASSGQMMGVEAKALFAKVSLYVVPMVNPDGVDLVTGFYPPDSEAYQQAQSIAENYPAVSFPDGWKANLKGVDLNLNYPAGWEQAKQIKAELGYTGPAPRDFVGLAPLDQPETVAMAEWTKRIDPALTLSYHTQGRVIYWKYLDLQPPGAEELGELFAQASGYTLEDTPYASGFAGYKDWFIQEYNRPGFTVEVGLGENPLPMSQFDEIYEENLGILLLGMTG